MIVCESPVDGLSYAELKGLKDYTVMASCGRPSQEQMKALESLRNVDRNKIILGDNDAAGKQLTSEFSQVPGKGCKIEFPQDQSKDFNDLLLGAKTEPGRWDFEMTERQYTDVKGNQNREIIEL